MVRIWKWWSALDLLKSKTHLTHMYKGIEKASLSFLSPSTKWGWTLWRGRPEWCWHNQRHLCREPPWLFWTRRYCAIRSHTSAWQPVQTHHGGVHLAFTHRVAKAHSWFFWRMSCGVLQTAFMYVCSLYLILLYFSLFSWVAVLDLWPWIGLELFPLHRRCKFSDDKFRCVKNVLCSIAVFSDMMMASGVKEAVLHSKRLKYRVNVSK